MRPLTLLALTLLALLTTACGAGPRAARDPARDAVIAQLAAARHDAGLPPPVVVQLDAAEQAAEASAPDLGRVGAAGLRRFRAPAAVTAVPVNLAHRLALPPALVQQPSLTVAVAVRTDAQGRGRAVFAWPVGR